MTQMIGLSGSLRKNSYNTALLKAAAALMPSGTTLEVRTIAGIPLFNEDDEATTGVPSAVKELKDLIATSDGLLLSTPEYNNSIPGPFKNAIDWISRPSADIARVFNGKPVALIGATPGGFGTLLSQNAWLPVLRTLGLQPWWGGRILLAHASKAFDANGALVDPAFQQQLKKFMEGFASFVGQKKK